jgi:hypothetical protein
MTNQDSPFQFLRLGLACGLPNLWLDFFVVYGELRGAKRGRFSVMESASFLLERRRRQDRSRWRAGRGLSMMDAILWLLWIPGSLILIAFLVDGIIY